MNELVRFQEPRLPYHQAIEERYGIDRSGWKALTEAVFPNAKSIDSVVMALSYCKARKLDPFKRPVHIVPMWSAAERKMVETVWPGVSEIRTTAFRTSQFAGMDEAAFGATVTKTLQGRDDKGNTRSATVEFPVSCRITVYRILAGQRCAFVGPIVYWLEAYGRWKNTEAPNDMWAKRPFGQLEKCAEAAALRRAFPEEIGNDYAAEEMEGQHLIQDAEAKPVAIAPLRRAPVPPSGPLVPAPPSGRKPEPTASPHKTIPEVFAERVKSAQSVEELGEIWNEVVESTYEAMPQDQQEDCERINRLRHAELPQDGDDDGGEASGP